MWSEKVTARAQLAEKLLTQPARISAAGILEADLRVLAESGREAEAADREQNADLAAASAALTLRKQEADTLFDAEAALRDKILAVIDDLNEQGARDQALFLSRLSYARFRIRAAALPEGEPPATPEETAVVSRVQRVLRADSTTRLLGFAAFCEALLNPSREVIQSALARRGTTEEQLTTLAAQAKELGEYGRNVLKPSPATQREAAAAETQTKKWRAVRRLIRRAVKGNADLEPLYARC